MNVDRYREARRQRLAEEPRFRTLCLRCLHPDFNCYCALIEPFDAGIKFVILMHKIEARRRVATGRMSHLCLQESELIMGHDFSENRRVNELLRDPSHECFVMYPGRGSQNLSELTGAARADFGSKPKKLVIFVIDGTWHTARQMIRSRCFDHVPRICFTPPGVSKFRVRKQPTPECYSTLEAIHHTIELLGEGRGFPVHERRHDTLLRVFDTMVERQIDYVRQSHRVNTRSRHHRDTSPAESHSAD